MDCDREPLVQELSSDDEHDGFRRVVSKRPQSRVSGHIVPSLHTTTRNLTLPNSVTITDSNHITVGPAITINNGENVEIVKVKFLGFNLETEKQAKRLRCAVATCLCWMILVTCAVTLAVWYFIQNQQTRIELDINSTWYITRSAWKANENLNSVEYLNLPVSTVIIAQTDHQYCYSASDCILIVHDMQTKEWGGHYGDIVPNFLVGGDGTIFEGRGANVVGYYLPKLKFDMILISFIGDYGIQKTSPEQLDHMNVLLDVLVEANVLSMDYTLLAYCQKVPDVANPGFHVQQQLNNFSQWNKTNIHGCAAGIPQYVKCVIKSFTRTERICFAIILVLIIFIIGMGLYCKYIIEHYGNSSATENQHRFWFVTRENWLSVRNVSSNKVVYKPQRLVNIQNSVTHECTSYNDCSASMKELQHTFLTERDTDIPYNFLVGNDGRVYEGRGWGVTSIHNMQYDPCALSIGFIGDYREELDDYAHVTNEQLENVLRLLNLGVILGHLDKDYVVQGAKDLYSTASPGSNLYNAIKKWDHYDHKHSYGQLTCDQIHRIKSTDVLDIAPHEWNISRDMWHAKPWPVYNYTKKYNPLRLVLIQNTVTSECHRFAICKIELQKLQIWHSLMDEDIPHNFLIANDGRVYEARGWGVEGGHSMQYNPCSVSIAFLGQYSNNSKYNSTVTQAQINRTMLLIEEGVARGYLHRDYVVMAGKDMYDTDEPGENLYKEVRKFNRYDNTYGYKGKTCDEIAASEPEDFNKHISTTTSQSKEITTEDFTDHITTTIY